jgi:hypothetical protein
MAFSAKTAGPSLSLGGTEALSKLIAPAFEQWEGEIPSKN